MSLVHRGITFIANNAVKERHAYCHPEAYAFIFELIHRLNAAEKVCQAWDDSISATADDFENAEAAFDKAIAAWRSHVTAKKEGGG